MADSKIAEAHSRVRVACRALAAGLNMMAAAFDDIDVGDWALYAEDPGAGEVVVITAGPPMTMKGEDDGTDRA